MKEKKPRKLQQDKLYMSPDLMISASLSDGPKHGYAIRKQIAENTQGKMDISYGNLYPILEQMQDAGLVHHRYQQQHCGGRIQKIYSLTDLGKTSFEERANVIKSLFNTKERREKQE